jgi:hypothetical protein
MPFGSASRPDFLPDQGRLQVHDPDTRNARHEEVETIGPDNHLRLTVDVA